MDKRLLTILRCPVSHKGLTALSADILGRVNSAIDEGKVVNQQGNAVAATLSEALVTDDGKRVYPVDDGIPVLLETESINMEQLD